MSALDLSLWSSKLRLTGFLAQIISFGADPENVSSIDWVLLLPE